MKVVLWAVIAVVAVLLFLNIVVPILLPVACFIGGWLMRGGYGRAKVALTRTRARGSLGQ